MSGPLSDAAADTQDPAWAPFGGDDPRWSSGHDFLHGFLKIGVIAHAGNSFANEGLSVWHNIPLGVILCVFGDPYICDTSLR